MKWIRSEDKLPNKYEPVIIVTVDEEVLTGWLDPVKGWQSDCTNLLPPICVEYWMPLPMDMPGRNP